MPVQGQEPFEEDLEWLKYGREIVKESPKVLDEAAKSFLAFGSTLLTVYTGALALFKLDEKASSPLTWAIICVPIVLWLLCISCLAYVYFPDRLKFHTNSPTEIEKVTRDISRKKSFRLKIGSVLFVAALEEQTIYLAMEKDGTNQLQNMSVSQEGVTARTIPVVLLSAGNQTHQVNSEARRVAETDGASAVDRL